MEDEVKVEHVEMKSTELDDDDGRESAVQVEPTTVNLSVQTDAFMTIMSHPLLRRCLLKFIWAANTKVYNGLSFETSNIGEHMAIYSTFNLLASNEMPFIIAIAFMAKAWVRWLVSLVRVV